LFLLTPVSRQKFHPVLATSTSLDPFEPIDLLDSKVTASTKNQCLDGRSPPSSSLLQLPTFGVAIQVIFNHGSGTCHWQSGMRYLVMHRYVKGVGSERSCRRNGFPWMEEIVHHLWSSR
jgi:hypothetical protein